ncbi:MAG: hypothetical protein A3C53_02140 [Omnitrophica WOR_2 bacterium RIFCSPHIGHO2_02_FULL_68_15]|nr:MAG: hypothetical protein A3C53_02140 [Omnitrophica WOR_2 bacterium RIFCSPHIGHO2_02_FULL_68_15]
MPQHNNLPGNHQSPSRSSHRVIALLNREQVDYLDQLGKDAQFSSGTKLSRTQILAAMVNALRRLNLTGEGVSTAGQFEQRIVDAMRYDSGGPRRRSA